MKNSAASLGSPTMTEQEWLACTEPRPMLAVVVGSAWTRHLFTWLGRQRERCRQRRLRLFLCACWRDYVHLPGPTVYRAAIEVAERYADGIASRHELAAARKATQTEMDASPLYNWSNPDDETALLAVSGNILNPRDIEFASLTCSHLHEVALLRDIFGNPFRPPVVVDPNWLTWNDGIVRRLAEDVYEERTLPVGSLDNIRLAMLADALEECGGDDELVGHLRGPGPHVRGCFVVDAILGRELA
jgi:hypothetical protein